MLNGLSATSYDIKNDLLTLYQGGKPVYSLHAKNLSSDFFVAGGQGGVEMGTPFYNHLVPPTGFGFGFPSATVLPLHSGVA